MSETRLEGIRMFTSAEVLQEILHVYLPVGRLDDLDSAMTLLRVSGIEVLALEKEDVELARHLHERHPGLSARDLCHLASCERRGIRQIKTFDRSLQTAFYEEG